MNLERLAAALDGKKTGSGYMCKCPAHDHAQASLSLDDGDKGIVFHCHAGCSQNAVLDKLKQRGLSLFLLTIGDSGERKTSCDRFFKTAIVEYESQQAETNKPDLQRYAADMAAWGASLTLICCRSIRTVSGRRFALPSLPATSYST